jgi:hypothetical protein
MKKKVNDLRVDIRHQQEILLEVYSYEGESCNQLAITASEEDKNALRSFFEDCPKFRGNRLVNILDEREIIWKGIKRIAGHRLPICMIYSPSSLKDYLGKSLRSPNIQSHKRAVYVEEILAMQYCLAFHSDYQDPCRTHNRRGKYRILVNDMPLTEVTSTYLAYPPKRKDLYEKVKKEVLEKLPKIIRLNLRRNTAANEFAFFYSIQEWARKNS